MSGRRAIVIAVDGLRASALGAYGNSWHPTPAFDSLAAQSLVVDWLFCTGPTLGDFYQAAWGRDHPLLHRAAAAGVACSLVSDATDLPGAESFADATVVATDVEQPAADVSQTGCASVLAVAAEHLEAWSQAAQADDKLLWVHLHGYMGPWDAPQELRAALLEEDDPVPPTFVEPPQFEATADQDAVLGYRAAYAAQTIVLDECVGGLLAALSAFGLDDSTLVVVIGCRGYALGEHGAVGGEVMSLYGETLHVPCLLRAPGLSPAPPRMTSLAQSADLMATLAAWFGLERVGNGGVDLLAIANSGPTPRQFVAAHGADGEQTLRTPAWLLRVPPEGVGHAAIDRPRRPELYVKPDDRWEANEIADRCGSVGERLLAVLQRHQRPEASLPEEPLDPDLVDSSR